MKVCSKCKVEQPLNEFYADGRAKDGKQSQCRTCKNSDIDRKRALGIYSKVALTKITLTEKKCAKCKEILPIDAFASSLTTSSGKRSYCRLCASAAELARIATLDYPITTSTLTCNVCGKTLPGNAFVRGRKAKKGVLGVCKKCSNKRRRKVPGDAGYAAHCVTLLQRAILSRTLKLTSEDKLARTAEVLGYTAKQLRARLEVNFLPGMDWSNRNLWHVDHTIPISYFIKRGETRPHIINALCNLKPLWAKDNMSKGDKHPFKGAS